MGLLIYARNLYFVVRSKPNPARAVKS